MANLFEDVILLFLTGDNAARIDVATNGADVEFEAAQNADFLACCNELITLSVIAKSLRDGCELSPVVEAGTTAFACGTLLGVGVAAGVTADIAMGVAGFT